MEVSLKNKRILVTGAGRGIGHDLCLALYNGGAKVIAVSRSSGPLGELKAECPNIETISVDLSNWEDTRKALENISGIDGLVNNAGIAIIKPFEELTQSEFDDTFNTNVKSAFNVCQIVVPKMKSGASIVNVSSMAGLVAVHSHSVYSMTKAAMDALTKNLALELGPKNIRVNSVNPTVILTKMGLDNWSDPIKAEPLKARIPLHRFGEVREVVEPIMFLLSDKSSYINGTCLKIEGGALA